MVPVDGNDVGVDPHKKTLTASLLDCRGGVVATASFQVSGDGHRALEAWAVGFGPVRRFGIEGACSLGRHTAMYLVRAGHDVTCARTAPMTGTGDGVVGSRMRSTR